MRANEFLDEAAIPKWAMGLAGLASIAGGSMVADKYFNQQPTQPTQQTQPQPPKPKLEHPDLKILAQTIWGEARREGVEGMTAVGHVIKNRAEANKPKLFGQGIKGVALKPKQFSCWNENDPNREKLNKIVQLDKLIQLKKSPTNLPFDEWFEKFKNTGDYLEYKSWLQAKNVAKKILDGTLPDITKGATYYHTKQSKPYWSDKLEKIGSVGNHIFYDIPNKSQSR
jgi:N-acetylmuramoyl-L-alanine amidase